MTARLCPACRLLYPPESTHCPGCGLPLTGPLVAQLDQLGEELLAVDRRLAQLHHERGQLETRRRELVFRHQELVRALRPAAVGTSPTGPVGPPAGHPGQEVSGRSVQTGLLALGGLLLAAAAVAFTVFAWGRFAITGRALILLAFTVLTLALPAVLRRFGLAATAETIAAVGLVLVALDGFAVWRVGLFGVDDALPGATYAGIVAAVVAVVALGYPALVPLRLPHPVAVVAGQAVLPLLAADLDLPAGSVMAALAAIDLGIVWWARHRRAVPELVLAAAGAGLAGLVAAGQAGWQLVVGDLAATVGAALVLAVLGGLVLLAAEIVRQGWARQVAAVAAVLAVAVGGYGVVLHADDAYPLAGAAELAVLLVGVAAVVPAGWRTGALAGGAAVTGTAAVVPLFWTVATLVAPLAWLTETWTVPAGAPAQLAPDLPSDLRTDLALALPPVVAAAGLLVARAAGRRGLPSVLAGGLVVGVLVVPMALGAPLAVALAAEVTLAGAFGALGIAGRRAGARGWVGTLAGPGLLLSLLLGAHAAVWATANRPATLATLGTVTALWTALAALDTRRGTAGQVATATLAALAALAEAGAVAAALGLARHDVAYPVLGTAVALAGVAAALRSRRAATAVAAESGAAAGAAAALVLTVGENWHTALVLTLAGLAVGLTALRPDRRAAGYVALGVEVVASWIWLDLAGVRTPEAYTVPAALVGLAIGGVALHRRPTLSSWPALGWGLAGAFLPSLALVVGGPAASWRALLLGVGALAVTLAGAATRRQAPFVLGGLTVAAVTLREGWPWLTRVVAALPSWVPLALAGVLLVLLGATYEQRRRDLRRTRNRLARMH